MKREERHVGRGTHLVGTIVSRIESRVHCMCQRYAKVRRNEGIKLKVHIARRLCAYTKAYAIVQSLSRCLAGFRYMIAVIYLLISKDFGRRSRALKIEPWLRMRLIAKRSLVITA